MIQRDQDPKTLATAVAAVVAVVPELPPVLAQFSDQLETKTKQALEKAGEILGENVD